MNEKLDGILEALLFVSGDGINSDDITNTYAVSKNELLESVERLKQKYSGDAGIYLLTYNGKLQFGSNPKYMDTIGQILNPVKEKALTNATLETVAIIAYKQPVTKLEIEQIRGLSSDYSIQLLLKHNLIEIAGRKDTIGKPLLYGTTDEFLKRFQISSLEQLPDYDELLDNIKVINSAPQNQSLYNEFEIPEETVPEFLQDEENLEKIG